MNNKKLCRQKFDFLNPCFMLVLKMRQRVQEEQTPQRSYFYGTQAFRYVSNIFQPLNNWFPKSLEIHVFFKFLFFVVVLFLVVHRFLKMHPKWDTTRKYILEKVKYSYSVLPYIFCFLNFNYLRLNDTISAPFITF